MTLNQELSSGADDYFFFEPVVYINEPYVISQFVKCSMSLIAFLIKMCIEKGKSNM